MATGHGEDLWERVLGTDPVGRRRVEVPARGGPHRRKGRTAKLTLRCVEVDLLPPKDRPGDPPVRMTAVSALEEDPPRRLDRADDLRKCLAFDANAITAFRVWDLSLLARERPDDPATLHVIRQDVTALRALAARHGFRVPRGPPDMTVARFVTLTGGLAGFHPSKRQPLPGTQKLREGVRVLSGAVTAIRAMRGRDGSETEEEDAESSVLD